MFGLSGEHLILVVLALFVFGPKGLPKLGSSVGKATRSVRDFFEKDKDSPVVETEFRRVDRDGN